MIRHAAILPFGFLLLAYPVWGDEQVKGAGARKGGAARAAQKAGQKAEQRAEQKAQRAQGEPRPADRALTKVQNMTPEERERWLSHLPPERREKIQRELQTVAKIPPAAQIPMRSQLERLNSLPQQKQGQVRRSLQQFNNMPMERKAIVKAELTRMQALPDDERRAHMNSEEFRNRFSPMEQQMMGNISEVLPQP